MEETNKQKLQQLEQDGNCGMELFTLQQNKQHIRDKPVQTTT